MGIGISGTSCHILNDDIGLYDVIRINELAQESLHNMSTTKNGKLQMKKVKLMVAKNYIYYGPWSIAPKHVWPYISNM